MVSLMNRPFAHLRKRRMNAFDNRFLKVNRGVVLTDVIEPVIIALDKYFEKEGKVAYVTSGLRTSLDQIGIIRSYLVKKGLDKIYPNAMKCELNDKAQFGTKVVYAWQEAWSALLNKGIIINPPIAAECLMDYIRDGKNKKGQIIGVSPHFSGIAFDIGGGADGIDGNVVSELKIIQQAVNDKMQGLKSFLAERNNNCVHIDCIKINN
jgi:hypothetical protein